MTAIQLQKLKINIFDQAKLFIEEIGYFAAFGATVKKDLIQPIGYYSHEEIVDSNNAVAVLQEQLSKKIKENLIDGCAIAFDVTANFKNNSGISEKRDALCLKICEDGENWNEDYFPYMIIDGECVWK